MECKHHNICDLTDEFDPEAGLCILHSRLPQKDQKAFAEALDTHRKREYGDYFIDFVFPGRADFHDITFTRGTDFSGAIFNEGADFQGVKFLKTAGFSGVQFLRRANFRWAVFTEGAGFDKAIFTEQADFIGAHFSQSAIFWDALFNKEADFGRATFTKAARFGRVTFTEAADFGEAAFGEVGDFDAARFTKQANFFGSTFTAGAGFRETTFTEEADFCRTIFSKETNFFRAMFLKKGDFSEAGFIEEAHFRGATFTQGANFIGAGFTDATIWSERQEHLVEARYIFAGAEVDFRQVIINSPDVVTFLGADLTKCQFLDTDLRKVQLVAVKWPQKGRRIVVYDEIVSGLEHELEEEEKSSARPWAQIEHLYRGLKQNYNDRRDYAPAGDFHYGEKEMQRRNPRTPYSLKFFLWLYWMVSGYGERFLRPLCWAIGLWALATVGYLLLRLPATAKEAGVPTLGLADPFTWGHAVLYSLQVMLFFRPQDFVLSTVGAKTLYTLQSLLGPLFLGLFALAVRQRLKH